MRSAASHPRNRVGTTRLAIAAPRPARGASRRCRACEGGLGIAGVKESLRVITQLLRPPHEYPRAGIPGARAQVAKLDLLAEPLRSKNATCRASFPRSESTSRRLDHPAVELPAALGIDEANGDAGMRRRAADRPGHERAHAERGAEAVEADGRPRTGRTPLALMTLSACTSPSWSMRSSVRPFATERRVTVRPLRVEVEHREVRRIPGSGAGRVVPGRGRRRA